MVQVWFKHILAAVKAFGIENEIDWNLMANYDDTFLEEYLQV